jgi:D-alanyl-D-alanine carboxypeptidase
LLAEEAIARFSITSPPLAACYFSFQIVQLWAVIDFYELIASCAIIHEGSTALSQEHNMLYSPDAIFMLEKLGIPLSLIFSRKLEEFTEASQLEVCDTDPNGRSHSLAPLAAHAWRRLKNAAQTDGVELYLISAFRSVARQTEIFERKVRMGINIERILDFSAPPLFSEHHTGHAVDIGTPGRTDLEQIFEETEAFAWLKGNAGAFGFEMSYPPGNDRGFAYEPWHWRYTSTITAGLAA